MSDLDELAQAAAVGNRPYHRPPRKAGAGLIVGLAIGFAAVGAIVAIIAITWVATRPANSAMSEKPVTTGTRANSPISEQDSANPRKTAEGNRESTREPSIQDFRKMADRMCAAIQSDSQDFWSKSDFKSKLEYKCLCQVSSTDITRTSSIAYPIQGVIKMTETVFGFCNEPPMMSKHEKSIVFTLGYKDGKWTAISGLSKVQEDEFTPSSENRQNTVGKETDWGLEQINKFIPEKSRAE